MSRHSNGNLMAALAPYDVWLAGRKAELEASEELHDCARCDGTGEVDCECDCPHCYAEVPCGHCDGTGKVDFAGSGFGSRSRDEYFGAVVSAIHACCAWKGYDFLGEVGQFVRAFREGKV